MLLFADKFQVFQVSSMFVQLQTDIGISVDWDGLGRLYVKADRRWATAVTFSHLQIFYENLTHYCK